MKINLSPRATHSIKIILSFVFLFLLIRLTIQPAQAQIYAPEGLNMPGSWNGWTNPPSNNLALANGTQVSGGRLTKINTGIVHWQTIIKVAATGGDVVGGTHTWLFTSGPAGSAFANKWANTSVTLNSLQSYVFNTGANNSVTLTNGKWYTVNYQDNGYASTQAIFMETSAAPVSINSLSVPTGLVQNQAATITLTASATPSAEERFYLRYSNDNWTTSSLTTFTMSGNTGTATIPGQLPGATVKYFAFSSTVSGLTSNFDLYTIKYGNNSGNNYTYSVSGLSSQAEILAFTFTQQTGAATINSSASTVAVEVAYGTALTSLTPTIGISAGATINPASGVARNFSSPLTYTVTAENGTTTKVWTVTATVAAPPPANFGLRDDLGVNLPTFTYWYSGQASNITEKGSVFNNKSFGTLNHFILRGSAIKSWKSGAGNVTGAQFKYKVWKVDSIEPASYTVRNVGWTSNDGSGDQTWSAFGTELDIVSGLTDGSYKLKIDFTITGTGVAGTTEDGSYTAGFVYHHQSTEAEMLSFTLPQQTGAATINSTAATASIQVAYSTVVTSLTPTITYSTGGTISPGSGVARDFSTPQTYTVTAEDGTTSKIWTVTVTIAPPPPANFGLRDDYGVNLPTVTYWYTGQGADLTEKGSVFNNKSLGLVNHLFIKGSNVKSWKSGTGNVTGAQFKYKVWNADSLEPASYTIRNVGWTSDDGNGDQTWSVFGIETEITSGLADGTYKLKIDFTITGTGVAGTTEDGSYTASFTYHHLSIAAEMLTFSLTEQTGAATITSADSSVAIQLAYGTSPTSLTPTITVSTGATISPASGVARDFSSPKTYTVTAEDGTTTKIWTVTVTVAPPPPANFGLRDDYGVNLPTITYWYTGQGADITEKGSVFNNKDIGTIKHLYIKGSNIKSWKSGTGNVIGAQFKYKVWNADSLEPANYTVRNVGWTSEDGGGNQTWSVFGAETEITSGLTDGSYKLKIDFTITGTGVAGTTESGAFTATFVYQQYSNLAEMLSLALPTQTVPATINSSTGTANIQVIYGTPLTNLAPTITVSPGARIDPASGVARDFSSPLTYTITAENGTTTKLWTVTVTEASATISWANLQWPGTGHIQPNQDFNIYAQVYAQGVTEATGQGANIQAWIGYSTSNTDPATWTHWIPATYFRDAANNDEYFANLGTQLSSNGTYYYASRFSINSGTYVYGGFAASNSGFWNGTTNISGVMTVTTPVINWANLNGPLTGAIALSESFNVYGQVFVEGFSGQSTPVAGLQAWVGISTTNTDPNTWTNWIVAPYRGAVGNNDEFYANIGPSITGNGTYYYATRYKLNNGSYIYGGCASINSGFWNGTTNVNGILTVTSPSINWVNLQFPGSTTIEPGQPFNVYGRAWITGHTGGSTQFPALQAWVGYSSDNTDPSTWTHWVSATYNGASGNNDEFVANLGANMNTKGSFYYATRYKVYNQEYVYGGYSSTAGGFWDGTANVNGSLTVGFNIDCSVYEGTAYSAPSMPVDDQPLTIYFDATKGNQALKNFTGDVYAHTAVLTNLSSSPSDWRYVKTNWGQNTPATKLTRIDANHYNLAISSARTYYSVPLSETIQKMVFVFRSSDTVAGGAYLEHRNSDGSDISLNVFAPSVHVKLKNPTSKQTILDLNAQLPVCVDATNNTGLSLYINNNLLQQTSSSTMTYMVIMAQLQAGQNWLKAVAVNGAEVAKDSVEIYFRGAVPIVDLPANVHNGINYINDSTVTLVLHDPTGYKQYVYAIGEFNDWQLSSSNYMNRTPDGKRYWVTLTGIEPGREYAFQYLIDGTLKIGDAYCEKILDPWNDQYISSSTYPNLKSYPYGKTDGVVSIFQTARPQYNWQVPNFTPPALNNSQSDLVIYELLLRDFVDSRSINEAKTKLDYLKELGVNAVQLMPIAEFDGNESWGYSTNFFFATDKYYGTKDAYKEFIDAAHQKGIAVILDIVPNHALGQCPMVQMYFDNNTGKPSNVNPWFNVDSPHGYSIGYDFNHESGHTRQFFKDVFAYWLNEFKIDGFRIDLSKGLTQKYTGGDIGAWNAYDQSRVNIINDYKAHIKWVNPNAYVILEHFADNSEETVLANSGMLLWSGMHSSYKQEAIGWETGSDVSWAFHGDRGWMYPNLVDYMETHDEERLMAEALSNGNQSIYYNIKDFNTALYNQQQAMVLFMGIPGPKMLYEFEELGYDYSIMYGGGRTASKPPRWDYLDVPGREKLNRVVSAMAALRKTDAFRYGSFTHDFASNGKRMWLHHSSMDVVISVNMGVNGFNMSPGFTKAGTWYNYFTGESFYVSDPAGYYFFYGPGDYRVFTSEPMPRPFFDLQVTVNDSVSGSAMQGASVHLSNSGNRTTNSDGKAWFTSLPKSVSVTASKFGWLNSTVDTLVSNNTNITIKLKRGWDPSAGWANLNAPGSGQIEPGHEFLVYGQAWVKGITGHSAPSAGLKAWIGYSTTNTDPSTWTNWIPATFHASVGNNDEYVANIGTGLTEDGTYYYASRFQMDSTIYVYGGHSAGTGGFWNGTTITSGTLIVHTIPPPVIEWANLQWPGSGTIELNQEFNVFADAYIPGITGQSTVAAGLQAWIGYSTTNTDPSTWTNWIPASYHSAFGNNDEFVANLGAAMNSAGIYYYASRFKYNSGAYLYGGFDAENSGFWDGTSHVSGVLTVNAGPPTAIDWVNLQWPGSGTVAPGSAFNVYAQAYIAGTTGQGTATSGLQAWIGYSTENTDPSTWTNWTVANYSSVAGNNDEFVADLGAQISAKGTYYYASRFSYHSGTYYYGGYSSNWGGIWDGVSNVSGVLTIANTVPTVIDWANLKSPGTGSITTGTAFTVSAEASITGFTGLGTAVAGLQAWLGYSTDNSDPSTWTNWISADYISSTGNSDEYQADLGAHINTAGTYYYASRFKLNTGVYVYGGYSAVNGGFWDGSLNVSGVLTLTPPTPTTIDWVNLQWPANGSIAPGSAYNVYAQAYIAGVTGQTTATSGLVAWIGYSTDNTDPATWTHWVLANYNAASGNNDEFVADLGSQISTDGTYYYASRFSLNSGTYVYGGYSATNGGLWNGTANVSGVLTVSTAPPTSIDWVNLQWPGMGAMTLGDNFSVYAQAYIAGVTGHTTATAGLDAWIGYSTENTDPSTWTNWIPATFNTSVGNNDEFNVNLGSVITSAGTYYYASRFKFNNGNSYYGGFAVSGGGFWDGISNLSGVLVVASVPTSKILNLSSVFIEGLYSGDGTMNQAQNESGPQFTDGIADEISVELHDAANYGTVVYSASHIALSTTGNATLVVDGVGNGWYYVTIRHRNSLETTTATAISFGTATVEVQFASRSDVYGNNLATAGDGRYLIYSGDINQDGAVDATDIDLTAAASDAFAAGYIATDVNNDGVVDGLDIILIDNNAANFVSKKTP